MTTLDKIMTVVLFIGVILVFIGLYYEGYKQGQIDAINGNIKYHLVTQPDSTKTWEKIK